MNGSGGSDGWVPLPVKGEGEGEGKAEEEEEGEPMWVPDAQALASPYLTGEASLFDPLVFGGGSLFDRRLADAAAPPPPSGASFKVRRVY